MEAWNQWSDHHCSIIGTEVEAETDQQTKSWKCLNIEYVWWELLQTLFCQPREVKGCFRVLADMSFWFQTSSLAIPLLEKVSIWFSHGIVISCQARHEHVPSRIPTVNLKAPRIDVKLKARFMVIHGLSDSKETALLEEATNDHNKSVFRPKSK